MFEQAIDLRQKPYVNRVLLLHPLDRRPSPDFGEALKGILKVALMFNNIGLKRHAPLVEYISDLDKERMMTGWVSTKHRLNFSIPGWYIGERFLINLLREVDTIPHSLLETYRTLVYKALFEDGSYLESSEFGDQLTRPYYCKLLLLADELSPTDVIHLGGSKVLDLRGLRSCWREITRTWENECLNSKLQSL